jgi:hypothetical protein
MLRTHSVVIRLILHDDWCNVPVQWNPTAWALAALPAGAVNRRPLVVQPATLFGLPAKLWL